MSLCQRTMLLVVVLVSCTLLLPTTLGRLSSRNDAKEDKVELRDLLKKLRERLEKNEEAVDENSFESIHDDFNEERSLLDEIRSSRGGSRGTGLHTDRESRGTGLHTDRVESQGESRGTGLHTDRESRGTGLHTDRVESQGESRGTGLHSYRAKTVRQDTSLTTDQQTQLVDAMNAKRRSVGAADMYKLHWNAKLARLAQDWSSKCNFVHGYTPYNSDEYDNFSVVGANLWAYQGPFDASKIVDSWYNDRVNFNRITQNCEDESSCGGYKQLVTSYTTDVGCGLSTCGSISSASSSLSNANFIVCYFGPAGNHRDVATFTEGPSCTLCKYGQFYCENGLCDKTCTAPDVNCVCQASCKQCSKQTSDCKCTCNPGSYGVDCGLPCENYNDRCGKRGYATAECESPYFQFVRDQCPLFCKECELGNPCSGGSSGGGDGGDSPANSAGGQQTEKPASKPVDPDPVDDGSYINFDDI